MLMRDRNSSLLDLFVSGAKKWNAMNRHPGVIMMSFIFYCNAECHYAERHYVECRYQSVEAALDSRRSWPRKLEFQKDLNSKKFFYHFFGNSSLESIHPFINKLERFNLSITYYLVYLQIKKASEMIFQ